jgi:hypothetical protein
MPLLPTYNERTDFDIDVTLVDADGNALVPDTAEYSIYDVTSATTIKDWTAFSVNPSGVGTISVLAADLDIVDDTNEYEERVLTVRGDYGASKELAEEYRFQVKNLVKIPRS